MGRELGQTQRTRSGRPQPGAHGQISTADLSVVLLIAGVAVIDPAAAAQAANGYLAAAGFTGTVRVRGDIVAVRVDTEYRTKFLGFVGLSRFPATGEGEARAVQALNGAER
jgi:hypothetical protein